MEQGLSLTTPTPRELVAVVQAFPHKASDTDYFSFFGLERKFRQDRDAIEKRYYELSRELHPDRFASAPLEVKMRSLDQMSFLNQAYQTLKNPTSLRSYLLELEKVSASAVIPADLAEAWFDIQDSLSDGLDPQSAVLSAFKHKLEQALQEVEGKMFDIQAKYDLEPSHQLLEELARQIQTQNYIESIQRQLLKAVRE